MFIFPQSLLVLVSHGRVLLIPDFLFQPQKSFVIFRFTYGRDNHCSITSLAIFVHPITVQCHENGIIFISFLVLRWYIDMYEYIYANSRYLYPDSSSMDTTPLLKRLNFVKHAVKNVGVAFVRLEFFAKPPLGITIPTAKV